MGAWFFFLLWFLWAAMVGRSGCAVPQAMDAEGLLEAGQHEALQPLGRVVQEAGLDQRDGDLVESLRYLLVRWRHYNPCQRLP